MPRPIIEAVRKGNMDELREFIEGGANVNDRDWDGRTALHWAAVHANLDAMHWLIGNNGDFEIPDWKGHTALHLAVLHGHPLALQLLMDYGASTTTRDAFSTLPLGMVCQLDGSKEDKVQIFKVLLRNWQFEEAAQEEEAEGQ